MMMDAPPDRLSVANGAQSASDRIWTIPNLLCVTRLVGSVLLVGFALAGWQKTFLGFYLFLAATDWVDGKLAILLNQRSVLGARLDSWADAALYAALLLGGLILFGSVLRNEWQWLVPAIVSYALSTLVGLARFKRWPSYHTRAAKTSWLLITLSAAIMLLDGSLWPLRVTMAVVTITNLEALGIGVILPEWRADVPSLWHAWKVRSEIGRQP